LTPFGRIDAEYVITVDERKLKSSVSVVKSKAADIGGRQRIKALHCRLIETEGHVTLRRLGQCGGVDLRRVEREAH
jgi:hypothetical protein